MIETYEKRSKTRNNILKIFNKEYWSMFLYSRYLLVSTKGNVRSLFTNRPMKILTTKQGYKILTYVHLDGRRITKGVHRIVAETFIPCKNKDMMEVNHINGDKSNNSIENLEWVTRQENLQHARDNNLFKKQFGKSNGRFKYPDSLVKKVKKAKLDHTIKELTKKYNLTKRQILHILYRR